MPASIWWMLGIAAVFVVGGIIGLLLKDTGEGA